MNKQEWLETALDIIETMPRDDFLVSLQKCGVLDEDFKEIEQTPSYHLFDDDNLGKEAAKVRMWRAELFGMDDEYLTIFSRESTAAPQEALYNFPLAA